MPFSHPTTSPSPIIRLPKIANPIPAFNPRDNDSPSTNGEASPTHSGEVATNTVELVMDVYSSELIQLPKCNPSNAPESNANHRPRAGNARNSSCCRARAMGSRITPANPVRHAAITSDGTASSCAQRIKIELNEMAKTPIVSTSKGEGDGLFFVNFMGEPYTFFDGKTVVFSPVNSPSIPNCQTIDKGL